jgi:hypothetical protein
MLRNLPLENGMERKRSWGCDGKMERCSGFKQVPFSAE